MTKQKLWALTAIDEATTWPEIVRIKEKSSLNISRKFDRAWLCRYPRPTRITFDNGGEFLGKEFQELIKSHGITGNNTTVKNPQVNARHERIHQTMAECLRTYETIKSDDADDVIDEMLQATALAMRSTARGLTKYSAGQLVFGRDMVVDEPTIANWEMIRQKTRAQQIKDNARENQSRKDHEYQKGDRIMIVTRLSERRDKLAGSKHKGPYEVLRAYKNGTLRILRGKFEETINVKRVKRYVESDHDRH